MEEDRRQSLREECDCKLSVTLEGHELEANLRNISKGGAFLHVAEKDNYKITSADTEKVITFRLANNKFHVDYSGSINRYIEDNNDKYLAVCLCQRHLHELV
jgi:hypothetical protein